MQPQPDQMSHYLEFCRYRERGLFANMIDLTGCQFIYPTTLLPLLAITEKNHWELLINKKTSMGGYLGHMLSPGSLKFVGKSYVPPIRLPTSQEDFTRVLEALRQLGPKSVLAGKNWNAYGYVIAELVDNIYDHSEFKNAFVMAQRYGRSGIVELCFLDDGITIPGRLAKSGVVFAKSSHYKAILKAIKGFSTKPETGRGYGLSTNVEMFRDNGGEVLVISGSGAIYVDKGAVIPYRLSTMRELQGTLISLRVKDSAKHLNVYDYLDATIKVSFRGE